MSSAPPLITLRGASVTFGGRPVFEDLSVSLGKGDRFCLVGRNGSGKSTLIKVLAGQIALDAGERFVQPGTVISVLDQDPPSDPTARIGDWVADGLPEGERALNRYRADRLVEALGLAGDRTMEGLSGGEQRRAALARALVVEPDILLLDEPTNHLDLPAITWLEREIGRFGGAMLVISHDRAFLTAVSRGVLWLDRGGLHRMEGSFAGFEAWQDEIFASEERAMERLDTKLRLEAHWLHRGVTARRKRNQGRLARLMEMRKQRAEWVHKTGQAKASTGEASRGGTVAIEARAVSKSFGDRTLVDRFSTRIRRGDRIGIIGPNGAGKTTLVRLLIGTLAPDGGSVHLGAGLQPVVFDQRRADLDPDSTPWKTLAGENDTLPVHGKPKHVVSYLRDFLFEDAQATAPIRTLSGGERNRLLLAKLLAAPSNLMILDEPTNDLDMDTLDLLTDVLSDYDGTLLLVSHDRDFVDRLATAVFAVDGSGRVEEAVGGFTDYLRSRPDMLTGTPPATAEVPRDRAMKPAMSDLSAVGAGQRPAGQRKLSYKDQRELDQLPSLIDALSAEIATLERELTDPALFTRNADRFQAASRMLGEKQAALDAAETRWLELEDLRHSLANP